MAVQGVTLTQFHHVCCAVANLISDREPVEVTAVGSAAILPWIQQIADVWLSKDVDIVVEGPGSATGAVAGLPSVAS